GLDLLERYEAAAHHGRVGKVEEEKPGGAHHAPQLAQKGLVLRMRIKIPEGGEKARDQVETLVGEGQAAHVGPRDRASRAPRVARGRKEALGRAQRRGDLLRGLGHVAMGVQALVVLAEPAREPFRAGSPLPGPPGSGRRGFHRRLLRVHGGSRRRGQASWRRRGWTSLSCAGKVPCSVCALVRRSFRPFCFFWRLKTNIGFWLIASRQSK